MNGLINGFQIETWNSFFHLALSDLFWPGVGLGRKVWKEGVKSESVEWNEWNAEMQTVGFSNRLSICSPEFQLAKSFWMIGRHNDNFWSNASTWMSEMLKKGMNSQNGCSYDIHTVYELAGILG